MIELDEIVDQASAMGIHTHNVQRDYVFGWLLSGLYQASPLRETLVRKGGNALRRAYLPATQFSDDLDFSTPERSRWTPFWPTSTTCVWASERSCIRFNLEPNRVTGQQLIDRDKEVNELKLYLQDFSGKADHLAVSIRVDVTQGDRILLPARHRRLIHPNSDAEGCAVKMPCVKLEEAPTGRSRA